MADVATSSKKKEEVCPLFRLRSRSPCSKPPPPHDRVPAEGGRAGATQPESSRTESGVRNERAACAERYERSGIENCLQGTGAGSCESSRTHVYLMNGTDLPEGS